MRTRLLVVLAAATAVAVLSPGRASAHDLQLVVRLPADAPGLLLVEAGFDDDTPADGARVVVTDAGGRVVAEGKTDAKGVCTITRPGPGRYTATVEAFGHKDRVPFEVVEATETPAEAEYRGWRPDQAVGLAGGVGGLLGGSAVYWWARRRKAGV